VHLLFDRPRLYSIIFFYYRNSSNYAHLKYWDCIWCTLSRNKILLLLLIIINNYTLYMYIGRTCVYTYRRPVGPLRNSLFSLYILTFHLITADLVHADALLSRLRHDTVMQAAAGLLFDCVVSFLLGKWSPAARVLSTMRQTTRRYCSRSSPTDVELLRLSCRRVASHPHLG